MWGTVIRKCLRVRSHETLFFTVVFATAQNRKEKVPIRAIESADQLSASKISGFRRLRFNCLAYINAKESPRRRCTFFFSIVA